MRKRARIKLAFPFIVVVCLAATALLLLVVLKPTPHGNLGVRPTVTVWHWNLTPGRATHSLMLQAELDGPGYWEVSEPRVYIAHGSIEKKVVSPDRRHCYIFITALSYVGRDTLKITFPCRFRGETIDAVAEIPVQLYGISMSIGSSPLTLANQQPLGLSGTNYNPPYVTVNTPSPISISVSQQDTQAIRLGRKFQLRARSANENAVQLLKVKKVRTSAGQIRHDFDFKARNGSQTMEFLFDPSNPSGLMTEGVIDITFTFETMRDHQIKLETTTVKVVNTPHGLSRLVNLRAAQPEVTPPKGADALSKSRQWQVVYKPL